MKFTIPASLDDAIDALSGVERLLTAKEWERAAIVAAFVEVGEKHVHHGDASSSITPLAFAARGIAGLQSKDTVRRYVEAWTGTGRPRPRPGEVVDLPDAPFPTVKTKAQDVAQQPGAVATALADATFRQKVIDRMPENTRRTVAQETVRSVVEDTVVRTGGRVPQESDYNPGTPNALDAVVPNVELRGTLTTLLRKVERLVAELGPIPDSDPLAAEYFRLQMVLATAVVSEVRR